MSDPLADAIAQNLAEIGRLRSEGERIQETRHDHTLAELARVQLQRDQLTMRIGFAESVRDDARAASQRRLDELRAVKNERDRLRLALGAVTENVIVSIQERRDQILESLRTQFVAKVTGYVVLSGGLKILVKDADDLDSFLRDLANNVSQALGGES